MSQTLRDLGPLRAELVAMFSNSPTTRQSLLLESGTVLAECSVLLEGQLVQFMEIFREMEKTPKGLQEGANVQFGWSYVTLQRQGAALHVYERDIDGDPFSQVRDNCTLTLLIAAYQAMVCRHVGAVGPDCTFQDRLLVARGCLNQPKVFLKRESPWEGHAGWFVGPLGGPTPTIDDIDRIPGYQIWQKRPGLISVLALPVGYIAVFEGDTIIGIADPQDNEVWAI